MTSEQLDELEPKGDDLDAMVVKFPAPEEWYQENQE